MESFSQLLFKKGLENFMKTEDRLDKIKGID